MEEQAVEKTTLLSQHNPDRHLKSYVCQLVEELRASGRRRTAETYRSAQNSLQRYLARNDILLSDIDVTLMCNYERYLRTQGISSNSTSFYLRVLRTIYNRAVTEGLVIDKKPFSRVYTGIGKTNKRAFPLQVIRKICELKTSLRHRPLPVTFFFSRSTHAVWHLLTLLIFRLVTSGMVC